MEKVQAATASRDIEVGSISFAGRNGTAESHALYNGRNVVVNSRSAPAWEENYPQDTVHRITLLQPGIFAEHAAIVLERDERLTCTLQHLSTEGKTMVKRGESFVSLERNETYSIRPGEMVTFGFLRCQIDFTENPARMDIGECSGLLTDLPAKDPLLPKDEQIEGASCEGRTELAPEEALQVKASLASPSSKSPPDRVLHPWTPQGLKAQKSDYYHTPGRSSSDFVWSSPFADPPAQHHTEPVGLPKMDPTSALKFSGVRQPSLQDWCDGSAEITTKRSRSALTQAQSLKLTPHGSPKLSRPGPIFTPGAPKKPARRSLGDVPMSNVVSADSLSDLLSCDEDLGLGWGVSPGANGRQSLPEFSISQFK